MYNFDQLGIKTTYSKRCIQNPRSSPPELFCKKKDVLKNFAKFTGKHLCLGLFLNKVAALIKLFPCHFWEIFMNTFSDRTPLVAASRTPANMERFCENINSWIVDRALNGPLDHCWGYERFSKQTNFRLS